MILLLLLTNVRIVESRWPMWVRDVKRFDMLADILKKLPNFLTQPFKSSDNTMSENEIEGTKTTDDPLVSNRSILRRWKRHQISIDKLRLVRTRGIEYRVEEKIQFNLIATVLCPYARNEGYSSQTRQAIVSSVDSFIITLNSIITKHDAIFQWT